MRTVTTAVLLAVAGLALAGCGGSSGPDEMGAKIACKQFVEDHLRAPSTADFQGYGSMTAAGGPTTWTVGGYVDAENGFGAQIRSDFTCKVSSADGDSWTLEDISGLS